ncbi:MAG: cyclic-di-AMP receptor [Erysipelotrichaceae bacterium]|nr:cyclic-di-AMP receptor [Erysipelotrichaceae bacterium]
MKLVLAIVSTDDTNSVIKALAKERFQTTKLATTGGFLSKGNSTLITGCEDEDVQKVIDIIGTQSKKRTELVPGTGPFDANELIAAPIEVTVGGATVFVLNVDQFYKI